AVRRSRPRARPPARPLRLRLLWPESPGMAPRGLQRRRAAAATPLERSGAAALGLQNAALRAVVPAGSEAAADRVRLLLRPAAARLRERSARGSEPRAGDRRADGEPLRRPARPRHTGRGSTLPRVS